MLQQENIQKQDQKRDVGLKPEADERPGEFCLPEKNGQYQKSANENVSA